VSLFTGHGPFSGAPAGWFTPPLPTPAGYVEPHPRRVQALRGGHPVIDTERALLVHRVGQPPSYALPADAVGDLPGRPIPEAPGFVHVAWDAVDAWLEEGRPLAHYPPNPYHRVDCRPTRRRLRVAVAGTTLVDTDDTVIVFETALPARLYVAPALVRTDLLRPTATSTYCNYKGTATYWAVATCGTGGTGADEVTGEVVEDVAWSYPDPPPESSPIAGYFSFDETRAEVFAELPVANRQPPPRDALRFDHNL
jgi:uncharacterized protein (DUF427 family)